MMEQYYKGEFVEKTNLEDIWKLNNCWTAYLII